MAINPAPAAVNGAGNDPKHEFGLATAAHVNAEPGYDAGHVYLIRPDAYVALSTSTRTPP